MQPSTFTLSLRPTTLRSFWHGSSLGPYQLVWWIDHDVVLLSPELPKEEIFFSIETLDPMRATFSVLKFPGGHPAMGEALEKCAALAETAAYGQTGADLFTERVAKYDLVKFGQPMEMTYPISALEVPRLFDPSQCDQLQSQCADSSFLHLFNETWRRAGIPSYLGPPKGSFIDYLLQKHGFDALLPRMELADLKRWTSYLTLLAQENPIDVTSHDIEVEDKEKLGVNVCLQSPCPASYGSGEFEGPTVAGDAPHPRLI